MDIYLGMGYSHQSRYDKYLSGNYYACILHRHVYPTFKRHKMHLLWRLNRRKTILTLKDKNQRRKYGLYKKEISILTPLTS